MGKTVIILFLFSFILFRQEDCLKITYLENKPQAEADFKYFLKYGNDQLDQEEMILIEAEEDIKKFALQNKYREVEIYVLEKRSGTISTESESGALGFVKLLVSMN